MLQAVGLDWRLSLVQECWFYFQVCKNWKQVIRGRLLAAPFDRFELRCGSVIAFPGSPSWQVFQEVWRKQIYTRNYPRTWPGPQTVVDIGANIGSFSLYAARRWHKAKILAYEPAPENVTWLQKNIQLSKASRIHLRASAVAGSSGRANFYLRQESGWHSLLGGGTLACISVQTTTLDAIVAELNPQPIDFLKIDCEGAEYDLLTGREKILGNRVAYIAMEYHEIAGHQVKEFTDTLNRAGFAVEIIPELHWNTGMLYASAKSY